MWVLALLIGSVFLSALWFMERTKDLSLHTWATKMIPIVIICELFYWYGFRNAPNFITARYTMSVMTHIFGWILVLFLLKEPVKYTQVLGAIFIIIGTYILGK